MPRFDMGGGEEVDAMTAQASGLVDKNLDEVAGGPHLTLDDIRKHNNRLKREGDPGSDELEWDVTEMITSDHISPDEPLLGAPPTWKGYRVGEPGTIERDAFWSEILDEGKGGVRERGKRAIERDALEFLDDTGKLDKLWDATRKDSTPVRPTPWDKLNRK